MKLVLGVLKGPIELVCEEEEEMVSMVERRGERRDRDRTDCVFQTGHITENIDGVAREVRNKNRTRSIFLCRAIST